MLLSLLAWGCAQESGRPPDVVLIVVDTLRADRLPFLGGPPGAAPFLDELARASLIFENAWSPSSWTLPATVSVLTSVHPFQHGVNHLRGLELQPGEEPVPVACIPAEIETLAEVLQAAGYRTFGVASNVLVGSAVGFDRGFDRFEQLPDEDAEAVNAVVERWRAELRDSEPFFLYVHYFDPHDTYSAREPWFEPEVSARSWPEVSLPDLERVDLDELDWFLTRLERLPEGLQGKSARELSPVDLRELMHWAKAAYDSEIGFVDARIRELFERLPLEDAVVVFLADHGEEFWEHGELTHGQNLHAETLRVPLLLRLPAGSGRSGRVSEPVSTLDVLPTLRRLLRLPPSAQDRGMDLLGKAEREPVLSILAAKSGQHELERDLRSIVVGTRKLVASEGGQVELYDLARDPGERIDLSEKEPEVAAALLELLAESLRTAPIYPRTERLPPPPSEALREHLRGIGYAGDD